VVLIEGKKDLFQKFQQNVYGLNNQLQSL